MIDDARQLVEAHQAGDEGAFAEIARLTYPSLYNRARRRLGSHHAAEDAVQETLFRAFRALPRFDGDFRLQAWLHRILANVCIDEGMRRARETGLVSRVGALADEEAPDPADAVTRAAARAAVIEALDDLPDSYRAAVALRYMDDLSYRDVASAMGITEENARARVSRGRAALQRMLSPGVALVALVFPSWRRFSRVAADARPPGGLTSPGLADHIGQVAVSSGSAGPLSNLSAQVVGNLAQAAPAVTRLAEVSTGVGASRSSVVANVVGAVAAIVVPAAAASVADPPPRAPVAQVQAVEAMPPAAERPAGDRASLSTDTPGEVAPGVGEVPAPSPVLPPPALVASIGIRTPRPVAVRPPSDRPVDRRWPEIQVAAPTPAIDVPLVDSGDAAVEPAGTIRHRAGIVSDDLTVVAEGPRLRLRGTIGFATADEDSDPGEALVGRVGGYLLLGDATTAGARRAIGELWITIGGDTYALRLEGTVIEERTAANGTGYDFVGSYRLGGARRLGFYGRGEASWTLFVASDAPDAPDAGGGTVADGGVEGGGGTPRSDGSDGSAEAAPSPSIHSSLSMMMGDNARAVDDDGG